MRIFLYGTLLDSATLAKRSGDPGLPSRCQPAVLRGWRRVSLPGTRWPTLRRCVENKVAGNTVIVGATARHRLAAYEGPTYRLHRVVLEPRVPAWTWIAPGGTRHPWRNSHDQL
jgi:hypothetical protein